MMDMCLVYVIRMTQKPALMNIRYLFGCNIGVRLVNTDIFPSVTDKEFLTHVEIMEEHNAWLWYDFRHVNSL